MLTDTQIRRAKPIAKPFALNDARGLFLIVNPSGSKWWRFRYSVGGKRNLLGFGTYPDVPLSLARERCDVYRKLIAVGIDPAAQRKAEKVASEKVADTFEVVALEWLEVKRYEWALTHYSKEVLRLEKHAFPWIGKIPMADIGVDEYLPILRRVASTGHLEQATRLRDQLSRVSRYAIATSRAKHDPAHALSEVLPRPLAGGMPALVQPDAIGELLRAMDGFRGTFAVSCALRLAPFIFCRPGELRMSEWAHVMDLFDGEFPRIVVPPENRKLLRRLKESGDGEPHLVPLSTQAAAILKELHPLTSHRKYIFPGVRDPKRCMSEGTINAALATLGYKGRQTGHGFRHVASTRLQELGWSDGAIEAQLAHKVPGVRGKYKRDGHLAFLSERRKMMQCWADYLDSLKQNTHKKTTMCPLKTKP
ncbi:MAG: integrase arm-type DNA-binding domain-containing protein [Pseudomonadota bacterium]